MKPNLILNSKISEHVNKMNIKNFNKYILIFGLFFSILVTYCLFIKYKTKLSKKEKKQNIINFYNKVYSSNF